MKKKFYIVGLVLTAAVMVGMNAMAAEPLGIGLCAPMSGGAASWGKKAEVGTKFAIDRINSAGGVVPKGEKQARMLKLLEVADDKNDPREGAAIAQRFVDNSKILAMVGPITSTVALAGAPILNKSGLAMVAIGATAPVYTKAGPYSFRVCPTDEFQGSTIARWARTRENGK